MGFTILNVNSGRNHIADNDHTEGGVSLENGFITIPAITPALTNIMIRLFSLSLRTFICSPYSVHIVLDPPRIPPNARTNIGTFIFILRSPNLSYDL